MALPQDGEQSASVLALQPMGQQPSRVRLLHWVMPTLEQRAPQVPPLSSLSRVQAFLSSQMLAVGHAPG